MAAGEMGGNGSGRFDHAANVAESSPAALFAVIWKALVDLLGTAASAAIVRRAARHAESESPELVELVIVREDLAYRYALPRSWAHQGERGHGALRVLAGELGRLLVELTGTVVVRRLEQLPEVRTHGLVFRAKEVS